MRVRSNRDARLAGALLILTGLLAGRCSTLSRVSVCATGEYFEASGVYGLSGSCVCKAGHVRDADGKGCHLADASAPTTTTSSTTTTTSSTTTTSTTLPPRPPAPPTIPPVAPQPTPTCIPEPPVSAGPADVRRGFAASSCSEPGENRKCFKDGAGGEGVPWEADERSCWPAWVVAEQGGRAPMVLGGIALSCEPGYLSDPDDTSRGCFDKYGRRYKWDGGRWVEQVLPDRFSGWWLGVCPSREPKTCAPAPAPTPTPRPEPGGGSCSLPAMPECGGRQPDSQETGRWGCCNELRVPGTPQSTPYDDVLEQVQDAIEQERAVRFDADGRVDEDEYVGEVLRRLAARGLCAKRSVNPSEEIGIKGSNSENYQYDLVLSNGRPRHRGYTAYCKPARF